MAASADRLEEHVPRVGHQCVDLVVHPVQGLDLNFRVAAGQTPGQARRCRGSLGRGGSLLEELPAAA